MKTVGILLLDSQRLLGEGGATDTPRLDAEILLAYILKRERAWLYAHNDFVLADSEVVQFERLCVRRCMSEPIAYLIGQQEFMSLPFSVSSAVLIPRPDTEVLVEAGLEYLKTLSCPSFLEIGSGSGCIAISLLHYSSPGVRGESWELSLEAIEVARKNRDHLGVKPGALTFVACDALDPASWICADRPRFDLIISNPPYIAWSEEVAPSVRDFEPKQALFAREEGLNFYRVFAQQAGCLLSADGQLMVEVGYSQAQGVCDLFAMHGWENIRRFVDLHGHVRVLVFRRSKD